MLARGDGGHAPGGSFCQLDVIGHEAGYGSPQSRFKPGTTLKGHFGLAFGPPRATCPPSIGAELPFRCMASR